MVPILVTDRAALLHGDSLDLLGSIAPNSIDSFATDPPAGIGFMGQEWDSDKGGRVRWIDWLTQVMVGVFRALKPGGHGLVWALPRTSHWTGTALEQAGFEVRDVVTHLFGTGFPKSLDVSKSIDDAVGVERTVQVGRNPAFRERQLQHDAEWPTAMRPEFKMAPATTEAAQWQGFGTALKPGAEFWFLVRKPLIGTVAENVLAHGTGGLNIDGCRIGTNKRAPSSAAKDRIGQRSKGDERGRTTNTDGFNPNVGRWPANVVLSHTLECVPVGEAKVRANGSTTGNEPSSSFHGNALPRLGWQPHGNGDGTETVELWACPVNCPVRQLDEQSGFSRSPGKTGRGAGGQNGRYSPIAAQGEVACPSDSGGASRFFYVAKPGRKERDRGCDSLPIKSGGEATEREDGSAGLNSPRAGAGRRGGARNFHPTVKSVDLMRWLIRLITPRGGRVLDPFTGSGSTAVAALAEGFEFVGFERDAEFSAIAKARTEQALKDYPASPEVEP